MGVPINPYAGTRYSPQQQLETLGWLLDEAAQFVTTPYGAYRDGEELLANPSWGNGIVPAIGLVPGGRILGKLGKATPGLTDILSRSAAAIDKGALTGAGRGLTKHGVRNGSAFPPVTGSPSKINEAGQAVVDDILSSRGLP